MTKNKIVFWTIPFVVVLLLVLGYFMFFQSNEQEFEENSVDISNSQEVVEDTSGENIKTIESASDLALPLSDLPEGWEIKARGERSKADVSESGLALGWIEGYTITFRDKNNPDKEIIQSISVYPLENIQKVLDPTKEEIQLFDTGVNGTKKDYAIEGYNTRYRIENISSPSYGDETIATKKTYLDGYLDGVYYLEFVDDKYYIFLGGYDYELMKELAQKIDSMIE